MSRFFTGASHTPIVSEATLTVNAAIKAMNHSSAGNPTSEQIADFAQAFTSAMFNTGGPFKAMLMRGARGPIDPVEIDFLKILIDDYHLADGDLKSQCVSLTYHRELLAFDDIDEAHMVTLKKEDVDALRSMSDVDHSAFVASLFKRRPLMDVVCVAKLIFGDTV